MRAQFTCFTGTKVHVLTAAVNQVLSHGQRVCGRRVCWRQVATQFTYFTLLVQKYQILTLRASSVRVLCVCVCVCVCVCTALACAFVAVACLTGSKAACSCIPTAVPRCNNAFFFKLVAGGSRRALSLLACLLETRLSLHHDVAVQLAMYIYKHIYIYIYIYVYTF